MKSSYALRAFAAIGASALSVLAASPAAASTGRPGPPVKTITSGLDGPYGLDIVSSTRAVVAESDTGEITAVNLKTGAQRTVISGLPSPSGVATYANKIFVVLGGGGPEGPPPPTGYPPASLLVANKDGTGVRVLADLMAYELKHNPDGQVQFDPSGQPYDALSNPFSMTYTRWGLLIADGGANDVLRVDPRTGKISTYFVPPNAKTPECLAPGAQANPGTIGCDSVPTGVAVHGKYVYVSTLGAEQPGAAAIWKLDGRTGKVLKVWHGFTSLTGIAVAPTGTVYASEVLHGAPPGEPPPGFDPSTVGRITRIERGRITHAQVTMPTGLEYIGGRLYATSWSIAAFLGIPHAGQLVQVNPRAFR
ncbi:ScyD/ScyE family protein [Phytohabitans sp. LJ34]|uniref:ScyD/ScyE family protein n=1 Tax=Phytohabitans sp. LJ34 TaxID=3452217 RepID=UPI003F898108